VATTPFVGLARQLAEAYGLATARIVEVAHPIGGVSADVVVERAEAAIDRLIVVLSPART